MRQLLKEINTVCMDFRAEERLFNPVDDEHDIMIYDVHIKALQQWEDEKYAC